MTTPGDQSLDRTEQYVAQTHEVSENSRSAVIEGMEESAKAARQRHAGGETESGIADLVKMGMLPEKPAFVDSSNPDGKQVENASPMVKADLSMQSGQLDFSPSHIKDL